MPFLSTFFVLVYNSHPSFVCVFVFPYFIILSPRLHWPLGLCPQLAIPVGAREGLQCEGE